MFCSALGAEMTGVLGRFREADRLDAPESSDARIT
jgi:hypothetical protein